jgi:hydrogenase maturation factor HypF (carbamoyltransferase family)
MVDCYSIQGRGIVEGAGFRPFVLGLPTQIGLGGSVKNLSDLVIIEIEADCRLLKRFHSVTRGRREVDSSSGGPVDMSRKP